MNDTKGLAKLAAALAKIKLLDKIVLEHAGTKLKSGMQHTIDAQTEPWVPLSPVTIARKGHSDILLDTHVMRDSIESRYHGGTVTIGIHADAPNNRAYVAGLQEHGSPDTGLPARPFLMPTWEREKGGIMKLFKAELKF